jgi:hypothetical protein
MGALAGYLYILRGVWEASEAMMRAALPVLHLHGQQAKQLLAHCAAYRKHAWQCLPPSPERNQTMRAVQSVEGRLSHLRAQGAETLTFSVTQEEGCALRQMMTTLIQAHGAEPPSEKRTQTLRDLAVLRLLLERTLRLRQT